MSARLVEKAALRYTPAGVAVVEVRCDHAGELVEAGGVRKLEFEFAAIAIGACAHRLVGEALGNEIELDGFLAPKSRRSRRLIVHVLDYRRP